ncbi:MAG TPA: DCC1-like thiol-disulfide oxidoreductase family protein [Vicinamibacterales bacterium]|nr:DCC1-like thiol-disulfide oxidoreductase family protein [Vicinamibacterales bacterium]
MAILHRGAEVFYDAECAFCVWTARVFESVLTRRHVRLLPVQTLGTFDEMLLRREDGTIIGGADAVVDLARRIWWGWPLWALSRIPGTLPLMRSAYRWVARHRGCASGSCTRPPERTSWPGFAPFVVALPLVFLFRSSLPPWAFMWTIAFGLYACCKWLTYWDALRHGASADPRRAVAYLLAWPGMDANTFLCDETPERPRVGEWLRGAGKIALGLVVFMLAARRAALAPSMLWAWAGMMGIVLMLHFGSFELLSLAWRRAGVRAVPLMQQPLRSTSLSELWGRRWNTAFHALVERAMFRPLRPIVGAAAATASVFLLSGVLHELVISVPARAGYGLPTLYFALQAVGVILERTSTAKALGLGAGLRGRLFTAAVAGAPVFILFPPSFVRAVMLPMLARIGSM